MTDDTALRSMVDRFLAGRRIAVVGATPRREKYGNKVLRCLRGAGYEAIPVHPVEARVEGLVAYRDVTDIPGTLDGASFIIPPAAAPGVLEALHRRGVRRVWFQPGSESEANLAWCAAQGMEAIHQACVLVVLGWSERDA